MEVRDDIRCFARFFRYCFQDKISVPREQLFQNERTVLEERVRLERNIDHREGWIEVQRYGNCTTVEFTGGRARCNYRCMRIYVSRGTAVNDAITTAELRAIYLTTQEQLLVSRSHQLSVP